GRAASKPKDMPCHNGRIRTNFINNIGFSRKPIAAEFRLNCGKWAPGLARAATIAETGPI
ncbi:MAG: hypothetical protein ACT6SC_16035, partial [Blastomonas fulva]